MGESTANAGVSMDAIHSAIQEGIAPIAAQQAAHEREDDRRHEDVLREIRGAREGFTAELQGAMRAASMERAANAAAEAEMRRQLFQLLGVRDKLGDRDSARRWKVVGTFVAGVMAAIGTMAGARFAFDHISYDGGAGPVPSAESAPKDAPTP